MIPSYSRYDIKRVENKTGEKKIFSRPGVGGVLGLEHFREVLAQFAVGCDLRGESNVQVAFTTHKRFLTSGHSAPTQDSLAVCVPSYVASIEARFIAWMIDEIVVVVFRSGPFFSQCISIYRETDGYKWSAASDLDRDALVAFSHVVPWVAASRTGIIMHVADDESDQGE